MTTILLISIAATIVLLWITSMVLWWQEENDIQTQTIDKTISRQGEHIARYGRRGYYALGLYGKKLSSWSTKKTKAFLAVHFPKMYKTIKKPDPLTGLKHGPASYFLHTISEKNDNRK